MTDREMLELAARAAGYELAYVNDRGAIICTQQGHIVWCPRHESGDALRLAVRLGLDVFHYDGHVIANQHGNGSAVASEPYGSDPDAATRLAILRCAAEVGRAMGDNQQERRG